MAQIESLTSVSTGLVQGLSGWRTYLRDRSARAEDSQPISEWRSSSALRDIVKAMVHMSKVVREEVSMLM